MHQNQQKHNKHHQNKPKSYHPKAQKQRQGNHVEHRKTQVASPQGGSLFSGNLVDNMRFGHKDHVLSGYVRRTMVLKDSQGNSQYAKEVQFFNSGKDINVNIDDHEEENRRQGNPNRYRKT